MGANLKIKTNEIGFNRKQSHDLKSTLKKIIKVSDEAVEVLVGLLSSQDEKIRLSAADKLLAFQIDMSDRIERDIFQRLLANAKFGNGLGGETEDDSTPLVDFTNIQDV